MWLETTLGAVGSMLCILLRNIQAVILVHHNPVILYILKFQFSITTVSSLLHGLFLSDYIFMRSYWSNLTLFKRTYINYLLLSDMKAIHCCCGDRNKIINLPLVCCTLCIMIYYKIPFMLIDFFKKNYLILPLKLIYIGLYEYWLLIKWTEQTIYIYL